MANTNIDDNLFLSVLSRIYVSEKYPNIIYDKKALEIKDKLQEHISLSVEKSQDKIMLTTAVRSANIDRYINDFLKRNPKGAIVQLGCGLETSFFRNDNDKNKWFEIDSESIIDYRKSFFGENDRDICIVSDIYNNYSDDWLKRVRVTVGKVPLLVTICGLFTFCPEERAFGILKSLRNHGNIEVVFDAVNPSGITSVVKSMNKDGNSDPSIYFSVNSAKYMADVVGAKLIKEEPYFAHVSRKGLKFMPYMTMKLNDKYNIVRMEHLKFD